MKIHVINLDRSAERLREFQRWNGHLPGIQRFPAIDGATIDRQALIAARTIAPGLKYTDGAIGCALSHLHFWEAAAAGPTAVTVCEDDAIFHHGFLEHALRLLASLPEDWDLVLWGWNFDSILLFDLLPGVSPCLGVFDQAKLRGAADHYQRLPLTPGLFRLVRAFGTVCYTLSPSGARKLLDRCLPIQPFTIPFPMVNPEFPNNGIDIAMNREYEAVNAYVSLPPLVVTANDHALSTVRAGSRAAAPA